MSVGRVETDRPLASSGIHAWPRGDGARAFASAFSVSSSWRTAAIAVGCCWASIVLIFADTIASIVASWAADPLGHGYAVVPGAAYLAWVRRQQLATVTPAPSFLPLLLVAFVSVLWLLGELTSTAVIRQSSVIAMFSGSAWAILGSSSARILAPSFAFCFFGVEIAEKLVPRLQDLTTVSVSAMLALTSFEVSREGHTIVLPGTGWQVADACSGINYLIASVMVSYIYAVAKFRSPVRRIGFVIAAGLIALLGNAVRVYATILIGTLGYTALLAGTKHYAFGWVVFSLILVGLFTLFGRWPEAPANARSGQHEAPKQRSPAAARFALAAGATVVLVGIGPLASTLYAQRSQGDDRHQSAQLCEILPPWVPVQLDDQSVTIQPSPPCMGGVGVYSSGNPEVRFSVAYQWDHRRGTTADNILPPFDEPWWIREERRRSISIAGQTADIREMIVETSDSTHVVWKWYLVEETVTASKYVAKAQLARSRLMGSTDAAAAIVVTTASRRDMDVGAILQDFVAHVRWQRNPSAGPTPN